ncbi:MAG: hypothetical protein LUC60_06325 [Lachnospiraceae bacterium]|nr:hypothetical protein [Lachnospiraceae bacterium]
MNAKQKLHQAKLAQWAVRCKEQTDSGLTVKAWCEQNNISVYTYNYWKHQLKSEYINSLMPDIVPVSLPPVTSSQPVAPGCLDTPVPDLRQSRDSRDRACIHISTPGIDIAVSSSADDELLMRLIKAVRYA